MWGPVYWPPGFVPEEHGWVLEEMNPSPAVPRLWSRWTIPFRYPAVICEIIDPKRGRGLTYRGPINGLEPEKASGEQIYAELIRS